MALLVSELGLVDPAKSCAEAVLQACPHVVFTSGRRTREVQALDMAKNVLLERNWVERTYVSSIASEACQAWIDAHPEVTDRDGIAEGLLGVLLTLSDDEYRQLTHHGIGEAFDVEPWSCPRTALLAVVEKFGGKVLWQEGDLPRWHVEFNHEGAECL